jgi:hypothetical protein
MPTILALLILLATISIGYSGQHLPVDPASGKKPDAARLDKAITRLAELGILEDAETWRAEVLPGEFVTTNRLIPVVIAAANRFEPAEDLEDAIVVLSQAKVLHNPDAWRNDLVGPKKIAGGVVALLFVALSDRIP